MEKKDKIICGDKDSCGFGVVENNCRIGVLEILSKSLFKEAIDFSFDGNPGLKSIGTKEQYCNYLKCIYPESEIKVPVRHGTDVDFDHFDDSFLQKKDTGYYGKGFYFREGKGGKEGAKHVSNLYGGDGKYIKCAMVNVKRPKILQDLDFSNTGCDLGNFDGCIVLYSFDPDFMEDTYQICVKSASQIHVLGSKEDLEGFKEYVAKINN